MAPYIFRYHGPPSENDQPNYVYRKRNKHDTYTEPNRKWKYDESSVYGETVYDYESEYTRRRYSPTPERHHNDSRLRRTPNNDHHHHHHNHHRDHHNHPPTPLHHPPHHNHPPTPLHHSLHHHPPTPLYHSPHHHPHTQPHGNYKKELRNTTPWSEPPLTDGSETHWYEVGPRTNHGGPRSEPRIALLGKRTNRHTHCSCHACPEKSSNTIPSMHYDQLRCPHCAAYAQPTQEEALVYPWTVQSYRPNRRLRVESTPPPEVLSITGGSGGAQKSSHSKAHSTILSTEAQSTILSTKAHSTIIANKRSPTVGRDLARIENKENVSSAALSEPLFRPERHITRSDVQPRLTDRHPQRQGYRRGQAGMSEVEEASLVDDVLPIDSISNVSLAYSRTPSTHSVNNYKSGPNLRTDTTYTREKYFQSLGGFEPRRTLPPPRPAKDTASEISRMLKGEYYDRRTGRTYAYNVNYAPGKIDSVRVPRT